MTIFLIVVYVGLICIAVALFAFLVWALFVALHNRYAKWRLRRNLEIERQHQKLTDMIRDLPDAPAPEGWQKRVLERLDDEARQRAKRDDN